MHIDRIVITGDVFRTTVGDPNQLTNVRWLHGELSCLHALTGLRPEIRYRLNAPDGGSAVIADWFNLLGHAVSVDAWAATYGQTAPQALVEAARPDYAGALVIGFELSPLMRSILDAVGAPWIDIGVSPIRFLEDLALTLVFSWPVESDHPGLVSPARVREAVARMRAHRADDPDAHALGEACVFLAQTRQDRTLIKDGAFFPDAEVVARVAHVLDGRPLVVKPHPHAPDNPVLDLLHRHFKARTTVLNLYTLLAAPPGIRFLTVSSSAAIEARHFGHASEMFHPAAHAEPHLSSLWAHRCTSFWRDALAPVLSLKAGVHLEERCVPNRLRRSLGFWGWPTPEAAPTATPLSTNVTIERAAP